MAGVLVVIVGVFAVAIRLLGRVVRLAIPAAVAVLAEAALAVWVTMLSRLGWTD